MTLVLLEKAARRFGDLTVLEGADLQVERGDRIGVVGPNGSGKTTLLRLVAGWDRPDEGSRRAARNLRIAFLSQIPVFEEGMTVRQAALAGSRGLAALEKRLEEIHEALHRDPENRALHAELARVQER
ncbi:MAG TPA: ABC-F family ATP-binding cassette domain-containing protein, partial [Planctomycetes bacterium]|nr:ABC-F family ATP-binding cassette domain-containing protein [Planctomycetota bacterium]